MQTSRAIGFLLLALAAAGAAAGAARAEAPLSAIDWLSQSVTTPAMVARPAEPATASGGAPVGVTVSVLGQPAPDAIGLLPSTVTGLPRAIWGLGRTADIAAGITAAHAEDLPALQGLLITLLLAESDPPADAGSGNVLLLARIDKLLALGYLDQAAALLQAAGTGSGDLFRRSFDVALLTGSEDQACTTLRATPDLAPTFPARIFCLARAGDWDAAALTLRTAQALGLISPQDDALLTRFLDTSLDEGAPDLAVPQKPSPLVWRLFEAIGQPLGTANLPLAFANADLSDTAGWRAQVAAAERLARVGAIAPNQLLGIYTAGAPAASGGIWDRVAAFQRFDADLVAGKPDAVAQSLPQAWARMAEVELEVPFATLYAAQLMRLSLPAGAAEDAFRIALLSPRYEQAARAHKPADAGEAFLIGLARGNLDGVLAPDSMARAIAPAFLHPAPNAEALGLLAENRLGEAVLAAIDSIGRGVEGDLRGVTEGLSLLRHVGLEDVARRTALQLMLLERRG